MKFTKQKKHRRPYYSTATRDAMREQMYLEIGRAAMEGKEPDGIIKAYNVMINPVQK